MGRRKRWVPDVIWQFFKSQARTLLETILHLIPPKCTCNTAKTKAKWRCLRCCFREDYEDNPVSYLIRPGDPPDYWILLNRSFVVVPPDAPPLLPDSTSVRRLSHLQIVRRTIETILAGRAGSTNNVLCAGYDKRKDMTSTNVKLLNSSAWHLLSERVGERIMSYILLRASIFLPIPHGKYQQVAGSPVTGLIQKPQWQISEPESSVHQGSKKRKSRGARGSSSQKKKLLSVLPCQEAPQNSSGLSETEMDVNLSGDKELGGKQDGLSIAQENVSLCSCCSALETSLGVPKGADIKKPGLYNLKSSPYLLPQKHMLYSSKLSRRGANYLIRKVFALPKVNYIAKHSPCSHNKGPESHGSACLYNSLVKLLILVISRARRCNNNKLLDQHCPVPVWSLNKQGSSGLPAKHQTREIEVVDSKPCLNNSRKRKRSLTSESSSGNTKMDVFDSQRCLNNCYNTRAQVVSFVWASCRKMVPLQLLGRPSCWRTLRRNFSRFVQLRRYEKFTLKQCMSDLKLSDFPAFLSKCYLCGSKTQIRCGARECATSDLRQRLFEMWIFWFFSHIVGPIIQANFYVTESEHGKQEMYFYRKTVWEKISEHAIATLKKQGFSTQNRICVRNITRKRPWGFSKLRFCPKQQGFRAIAGLNSPSRYIKGETDEFGYAKSVNHFLRDILPVFRDLLTKNRENWGASVFSYNDIYEKLVPFLMSVKKDMKAMPALFIVVADVKKAFDTVNQEKALGIVDEILTKDEYLLHKSNEVACRKKSLWSYENLSMMNQQSAEKESSGPSRPWNTIVIDQEQRQVVRKEKIKFYLRELLKHNVLYVDEVFIMQKVGIPQGSSLSTMLCSLYLGHLERKRIFPLLKRVCAPDQETDNVNVKYTLFRYTDDFLFISTSKNQASSFFSRMQIGFGEYNIYMNNDKYCLNFDMEDSPEMVSRGLVVDDDGVSFIPWGGLLINSQTLEIQADYTKYKNSHMSSTLTINRQGNIGSQLKQKLCDYMRPKCHPILFDSNINSHAIVRLNIYQAFLLAAMKFHGYVRELFISYNHPPRFYFDVIQRSLKYMHKLIRKRMKAAALSCKWEPILELDKEETIWLGRTAYIRVLTKKEARYKDLICILRSKREAQGDIESCPGLMYAVEDSHSSYVWKLEY